MKGQRNAELQKKTLTGWCYEGDAGLIGADKCEGGTEKNLGQTQAEKTTKPTKQTSI